MAKYGEPWHSFKRSDFDSEHARVHVETDDGCVIAEEFTPIYAARAIAAVNATANLSDADLAACAARPEVLAALVEAARARAEFLNGSREGDAEPWNRMTSALDRAAVGAGKRGHLMSEPGYEIPAEMRLPRERPPASCAVWEARLRERERGLCAEERLIGERHSRLAEAERKLEQDRAEFTAIRAWWLCSALLAVALVVGALSRWAP